MARPIRVEVSGWEKVVDTFGLLGEAAKYVGHLRYAIQNPAPYTFFINYGYYFSGRPGRRAAGGAHMLEKGQERIEQRLPGAMVNSLLKGPTTVRNSIAGVMGEGTRATKAATPVRTGRLRGGFHTVATTR